MLSWVQAFLLGQLIEAPLYCVALRARAWPWRGVLALVPNALTHPVVWFVFPRLIPEPYLGMAIAAEAFAVGVEALYLWALGVRRALLWSLASNAASLSLGLITRVGWS